MSATTQEQFQGMEQSAPVDMFDITPENLERMAEAQRKENGLLNFKQAAVLLSVSWSRVGQLATTGQLRRFSFCGQHYVSYREVCARRSAEVRTGRPKSPLSRRALASIKATLLTDKAQAANGGYRGPCEK